MINKLINLINRTLRPGHPMQSAVGLQAQPITVGPIGPNRSVRHAYRLRRLYLARDDGRPWVLESAKADLRKLLLDAGHEAPMNVEETNKLIDKLGG